MPSMIIRINDKFFDTITQAMCDQAVVAVRENLPAEGKHARTPIELDIVRRHPFGKCVRNFLIEIEAGDDPERQLNKKEITEKIGDAIAYLWGRVDIAVRLRLQDGTFYVYAADDQ